jgi:predicted DNA-binding transcriptional regulator YafY
LDFIELRTEAEHDVQKPSKRTFRRDKAEILSLYGLDIKYSGGDRRYYLSEQESAQLGDRIIEAYNIANVLKLPEAISGQILFEKRRPKGTEHFNSLLQAIREQQVVRYTYHAYAESAVTERTVHPYALKEFKGRWYLLASEGREGPTKSFGLDRITDLEITKQTFKIPKGFNPEEKYRDCFGITGPNSEAPGRIVLSFEPLAGRYIKSFPLHHSQELLVDNQEEIRIADVHRPE